MADFSSLGEFIAYKLSYKKMLIEAIEKYAGSTKKTLEVGCGSGITSTYLAKKGYAAVGVDSDDEMLDLAAHIAQEEKSSVLFKKDNIASLDTVQNGHFDVIFSNGVMEHFSDAEIISMLNLHIVKSTYVIVSIPSDYFTEAQRTYGNERFMSKDTWHGIIAKTNAKIVEEFYFDSDLKKVNPDKPQFIVFVLSSR